MAASRLSIVLASASLVSLALPHFAFAQWTRVTQVPQTPIYSVWANGDTVTAGGDGVVFLSTNGGVAWNTSAAITAGAPETDRARMRNGRLYAATRGAGIFISDNQGTSWASFNQNLTGGFGNSQLDIIDLVFRGDSLFLATEGDGAWVRNLRGGTWTRFGSVFGPAQATNMTMIAAAPTRLLSGGGFNGSVFFRDPGDADWTESLLFNDHLAPGLASLAAIWTGNRWVVGANIGAFLRDGRGEPWTFSSTGGSPPFLSSSLTLHGGALYANFGNRLVVTFDEGSHWQLLDTMPAPTSAMTIVGETIYVSRIDGLFRRPISQL